MKTLTKTIIVISAVLSVSLMSAKAQIIITEVDAAGSGTAAYAADWFELTNEGTSSVSIAGWTMDDSHDSSSAAVALTGVSSIGAGQSVVFIESTGTTSSAVITAFENAWFGSTSSTPAGFTIGTYSGGNVGLSQGGDAVNIYDGTTLEAGVQFGASSTSTGTFDNSVAKLDGTVGTGSGDPTLATFSVAGVNGAFDSKTSDEVGSPGVTEAPEPSSFTMILGSFGLLALGLRRRIASLL